MLQLQVLRQNPQAVKERLAIKHFSQLHLIDEVIAKDDERKKLQLEFDNNQAKVNSISKDIGVLMSKGLKEEAEARKQDVALLKSSLQPISEKLATVEKHLHDELIKLPNLPSEQVPSRTLVCGNARRSCAAPAPLEVGAHRARPACAVFGAAGSWRRLEARVTRMVRRVRSAAVGISHELGLGRAVRISLGRGAEP